MALVIWNACYVLPEDRGLEKNTRSDMRYGATREGVQKLEEVERTAPMSDAEGLNYIANRRGVQRIAGEDGNIGDGLFNAGGKADLEAEKKRLENHPDSTEWRAIISFTKDDLQRVGYDDPDAFRKLLAAKMPEIGKQCGISPENLVWNAAFHPIDKKGRDHHPHYHVYFYSTNATEGVGGTVRKKKLEKARSILTNTIFPEDMGRIQAAGREAREQLNLVTQKLLEDPNWMLSSGFDTRLQELGRELPKTGKKTYGFLPSPLKKKVDDLFRELIQQPGMADAYAALEAAQRDFVLAYNDREDLIQQRMYQWQKHFFHPTGENDRATLHNRLIHLAETMAKEDPASFDWIPTDDDVPPQIENALPPEAASPLPDDSDHILEEERQAQRSDEEQRQAHIERLARRTQQGDMGACFWLARMVRRDDPEMAEKLMDMAAQRGHSGALQEVAKRTSDPFEKKALLEKAAAGGDPDSLYKLGKNAEQRHSFEEAIRCYEQAANKNVWAALRLATLYTKEEWYDPEQAEHYRQTARALVRMEDESSSDKDVTLARYRLGFLYQEDNRIGDAVMEYSEAAIKGQERAMRALVRIQHHPGWMRALEEQESAEFIASAQGLAKVFEDRLLPCADFPPEYRQARKLLTANNPAAIELLVAEAGTKNVLPLIDLGRVYEEGKLVEVDLDRSNTYYTQARRQMKSIISAAQKAEKFNAYLEFRLGNLMIKGKGAEPDVGGGMLWYEEAMDHGSAMAALELAHLYEKGELIPKDLDKAYDHYEKAITLLRQIIMRAENDENREPDPDLEFRLGQLLMDGKGCEPNIEEATVWFRRALGHGSEDAKDRLARIYLEEDVRVAVSSISGAHALQRVPLSEQPEMVQATVKRLAEDLSDHIPEDLRETLKDAAAEYVTEQIYRHDVSVVVTGIYKSAAVQREDYRELASHIRCGNNQIELLSYAARDRLNRLLPEAFNRADEGAKEQMQQAVLQIATGERVKMLLESDPDLKREIVRDTEELRTLMRTYSCTKYRNNLPESVQQKLEQTAERIARRHTEFSEAAQRDPKQWQRQVWNVAAQQLQTQTHVHRFSRGCLSSMLVLTNSISRMAAAQRQQQEQQRTPEHKKKSRTKGQTNQQTTDRDEQYENTLPMEP